LIHHESTDAASDRLRFAERYEDEHQSLVAVAVQVLAHGAQLPTAGLVAQVPFHDFGADFAGDGADFVGEASSDVFAGFMGIVVTPPLFPCLRVHSDGTAAHFFAINEYSQPIFTGWQIIESVFAVERDKEFARPPIPVC